MLVEKIETAAQAGEHAERENVDLQNAERIEIVLVPFDRGALGHGRIGDRGDFVEPRAGDDETAGMLRQMARKAGEFAGDLDRQGKPRLVRVEADASRRFRVERTGLPAPGRARQSRDGIFREAEDLADVADRRTRPVGDDARREAGVFAPIMAIDILHHLFAPFVLEIDIDVGRLVAFGRNEPFEQQVVPGRVDLGDAQAEADGGIRRRAAALAENVLAPAHSARCRAR